ncbi:hypothetical protein JMN32_06515 [Fulvivirga sp. 29W222]|uniref:Lipoprotein n=1 Tax=Fulvivirga marina TaxID=2494733 RepID=A0A937KD76_9BACT|nr:hypothetical protein [Fulvivirga marina]MBL6445953.1 hypothetical protein [Fulvivirga marina]
MNFFKPLSLLVLSTLLLSCDPLNRKNEEVREVPEGPFEGEIALSESRGLYGSLFKTHTSYLISENTLKREERLGGLNDVFDNYAGIIIDLEKDSVTLYYADITEKFKHTLTVKEFKAQMTKGSLPRSTPSPIGNTFSYFSAYTPIHTAEDSVVIEGFNADYNLYREDFFQQEIYDCKKLQIKRELLKMVFPNLPANTNFVLKSEFKTILTSVKNDSIVNNDQVRLVDELSRGIMFHIDSVEREETNLEKLSKSKWVNMGLNLLKKGIDLNLHISSEISKFSGRGTKPIEFSLPSGEFKEIDDFDAFCNSIPTGGEFDD